MKPILADPKAAAGPFDLDGKLLRLDAAVFSGFVEGPELVLVVRDRDCCGRLPPCIDKQQQVVEEEARAGDQLALSPFVFQPLHR